MAREPDLADQVEVALSPLSPLPIVATLRGGTVYLEGTVVAEHQRRHAEALVRAVRGVQAVVNRLHVEPAGLDIAPSARQSALALEAELPPSFVGTTDEIAVVEDGGAYTPPTDPVVEPARPGRRQELEVVGGFAATSMESPLASEEPGAPRRGDEALCEEVVTALHRDAATIDLPVNVGVRNGVAYLRGRVPSLEDVELIEEVVSRVPGILDVDERLEIEGQ